MSTQYTRKGKMAEPPGAWISEVYAPRISFTVEDILEGKAEDVSCPSKIKRAGALDPQNIQETYARIQQMFKWNEEMMKQRAGFIDAEESGETEEKQKSTEKTIDLKDPCIWDEEELAIIRKVSKEAKAKISDLEVQIREMEKRNQLLETEVAQQRERGDELEAELKEARKANKRLKIHLDSIQGQLEQSTAKTDLVTEMWKEIDEEKTRMMKEMKELRISAERERVSRGKLELQLDQASSEANRQMALVVENTKSHYEIEMARLHQEIARLQEEIKNYRSTHDTTQKALKHMTAHFASLPLRDIVPPNVVTTDQVSVVDYVG